MPNWYVYRRLRYIALENTEAQDCVTFFSRSLLEVTAIAFAHRNCFRILHLLNGLHLLVDANLLVAYISRDIMFRSLFFIFLAVANAQSCFPFAGNLASTPSTSRSQWWCPQSDMYGFMGFSYPLEVPDCSDPSNGYDQINKDFAKMKADFGAVMVRVYAPECREAGVWENLVKAGVNNNMGVIVQVWWGFGVSEPTSCLLLNADGTGSKSVEGNPIFDLQRHGGSIQSYCTLCLSQRRVRLRAYRRWCRWWQFYQRSGVFPC